MTGYLLLITSFLFITATAIITPRDADFYQAAVVEYSSLTGNDANETFTLNGEQYVKIIAEASKLADIVVFPETGLLGLDNSLYVTVPAKTDNVTPAESDVYHPVLRQLSQAAISNNIYVAVNLHEKAQNENNQTVLYNTNVVFDRNGKVVARYRKYHLFRENYLNVTKNPEVEYFVSDFGVTFGTFTCFDILFEQPAKGLLQNNVTDIIYPTFWFSELPFLTAVQVQSSWSYTLDMNLLAAGGNKVVGGTTGSGIYNGKKGPVTFLESRVNETRILSARIYKKGKNGTSQDISPKSPSQAKEEKLLLLSDDISIYKTEPLLPKFDEKDYNVVNTSDPENYEMTRKLELTDHKVCQGRFCCHFDIQMIITYRSKSYLNISEESYQHQDSAYHYQYRMAVFDGVRNFGGATTGGMQVCGIIPCSNNNVSSCSYIKSNPKIEDLTWEKNQTIALYSTTFDLINIRSWNFTTKSSIITPNLLESSNDIRTFGDVTGYKNVTFTDHEGQASWSYSSKRLVAGGLINRVFSRDGTNVGPTPAPSGASSINFADNSLLLFVLSILATVCTQQIIV